MVASEQFRPSPLVAVFDFGYEEVDRQVKTSGSSTTGRARAHPATRHQRGAGQAGTQHELAGHHRSVTPVHRSVRHRAGHHPRFRGPRVNAGQHQPARRGSRNLGGADRHRGGPGGGHSRGDLLQPFRPRDPGDGRPHGRLLAGVPEHGRAHVSESSHGDSSRERRGFVGPAAVPMAAARFPRSTSRLLWTWCWCC